MASLLKGWLDGFSIVVVFLSYNEMDGPHPNSLFSDWVVAPCWVLNTIGWGRLALGGLSQINVNAWGGPWIVDVGIWIHPSFIIII